MFSCPLEKFLNALARSELMDAPFPFLSLLSNISSFSWIIKSMAKRWTLYQGQIPDPRRISCRQPLRIPEKRPAARSSRLAQEKPIWTGLHFMADVAHTTGIYCWRASYAKSSAVAQVQCVPTRSYIPQAASIDRVEKLASISWDGIVGGLFGTWSNLKRDCLAHPRHALYLAVVRDSAPNLAI